MGKRPGIGETGLLVTFKRQLLLFCAAICLRDVIIPQAVAAWHDPQGDCRKELKVDGTDGSAVTATTTVFLDDRFTGLALTDTHGVSRPFGLLNRLGSRVSIHFDAKAGESLYLYPSATVPLPRPGLEHCSGLRHLVRSYDGREVLSSGQFSELWKSGEFQGGEFIDQVYGAFNPFGSNAGALHFYDGFLKIDKAGPTAFCVASTDASFLFIDNSEAVAWPGKHPIKQGLDGSRRGTVTLQPGLHRFTYLHANSGNESFAIAAMVQPNDKRHFVIGPESFTRASYAYIGPLLRKDDQRQADFIWENRYMLNIREHALYDLSFEAASLRDAPDATYAWDFGDGTRGNGMKAEHLYFACGDVPVTLTVTLSNGQTSSIRQTVRIAPRYGQSENDDSRALDLLDLAVRQEKESGIQPQGYALISRGFFFFLKEPQAAAFAGRVLAAVERIPESDLHPLMNELALGVQQVDEQYELSERCFRVILDKVKDPKARASSALHLGGMLNLCLNRPQEARAVLAAIRKSDLIDWEQRLLDIYLADTSMVLDDFATARKQYLAISKPSAVVMGSTLDRNVLFDYNSRYFRLQNLLSQQLYSESLSELDMLEWEIPEERASPRMNLLKVQALVGNKQPRKAVVCLQRALLADVDETYTPALRLELAKLYLAMNQLVQAKHQIALIRKESPWTREEIDARKLLEEIERKIGEVSP